VTRFHRSLLRRLGRRARSSRTTASGWMARNVVSDAARAAVARRLRRQARACHALGSPLYSYLLERSADDAEAGGPAWSVLEGHESDPPGSALALRLMGAVHRLVLEGRAPSLAMHYPSAGGEPRDAWPAFEPRSRSTARNCAP
jgi:hypothetical protein